MHGDIDQLVAWPATNQFAVAIEIWADSDMIDSHQIDDVVDMPDRVTDRSLFSFWIDESFVKAYLYDSTLFCQCFDLGIG